MTDYYYDNTPVEIVECVKTKYPIRLFYKRRYKDGDKVELLVDCYGFKTTGLTGTVSGKKGDIDKGHYSVVLDGVTLRNGKPYGFTIKARGLKAIKKAGE
jgi:hypothetical protein